MTALKKLLICDFAEYNSKLFKLGNYHFCNCFVKDGYEALWMSNVFNHLIYFKDKEDFRFKKSISKAERHQLAKHIYGFAPYSLRLYGNHPFSKNPRIVERLAKTIVPNISESLEKLNFLEVDVLWISNPKAYWVTKVVKYKKLIYRIADDYSQCTEFPNIAGIDELLIKRADSVIIASSTLKQHVLSHGKEPVQISNGVEFDHFNHSDVARPVEYLENERQRIIYVGALRHWFDTELVRELAQEVDADIFLVGKCETDLSSLEDFQNVYILGARPYDLIPGYLKFADVALIPFLKNGLTDSVSPIKLYEYCSAGVAVVSTNLTETSKQNAPIWLAKDHQEFISGVRHYLTQGYDRSELTEYGRLNSWDSRYELMKKRCLE